jgi:hypothetical protein
VTCSANGECDFTCAAPYQKAGNACVCQQSCCSDDDCDGTATCQGGQCQGGETCDDFECGLECVAEGCLFGACDGDTCLCIC